jgi:ribosome-associated protein
MTTEDRRLRAINEFISDRKGEDLIIKDLRNVNSFLNYFVIVTGNSNTHCRGMARGLMKDAHDLGCRLAGKADLKSPWIVIDFHDIIVHVFPRETRDYYQLDRLWADALTISFP